MVRRSVAFTLHHPEGSPEEAAFLDAAEVLAGIPGVERFQKLRETSPKNGYRFAFAVEFAHRSAYEACNGHPDHVAFVESRWMPEVAHFLEIDTEPLG